MWRQVPRPPILLPPEPACLPVARPTHHPVCRQVCPLLTILSFKRCLLHRPMCRQFSWAPFVLACRPAGRAVPRPPLRRLFTIAQYVGKIVALTSGSVSAVVSTSAKAWTWSSVPSIVLAFIPASVAANLLSNEKFFTWPSVSLNVLAFSSASLSASVLTNALTFTSLRVSRHVSFSLSLLACKQAHLSVQRLAHLMVCLQVF